jgi:hypothetical protein
MLTVPGIDWDQRTRSNGVFRIAGQGRKGWSRRVDKELGNYDFLLGKINDTRYYIHFTSLTGIDVSDVYFMHLVPLPELDVFTRTRLIIDTRTCGMTLCPGARGS